MLSNKDNPAPGRPGPAPGGGEIELLQAPPLSMSADAIGPVKAAVLALDAGALTALMDDALADEAGDAHLRPRLIAFAEAHDIPH